MFFFETIDLNHPLFNMIQNGETIDTKEISFGSAIYAHKPGDGSAREQAASSQKVLGGWANFAQEYATKRYHSNLINWGLIPFIFNDYEQLELNSFVYVPHIKTALFSDKEEISAYVLTKEKRTPISLSLGKLSTTERQVLVEGS